MSPKIKLEGKSTIKVSGLTLNPFDIYFDYLYYNRTGNIIHKLKANKGLPFKTYETLYHKCVVPISDFCSGV